jgi:hypothetical protein
MSTKLDETNVVLLSDRKVKDIANEVEIDQRECDPAQHRVDLNRELERLKGNGSIPSYTRSL